MTLLTKKKKLLNDSINYQALTGCGPHGSTFHVGPNAPLVFFFPYINPTNIKHLLPDEPHMRQYQSLRSAKRKTFTFAKKAKILYLLLSSVLLAFNFSQC